MSATPTSAPLRLDVRFDGNGAPEVLAVAKREVKARLKAGMASAAESTILPEARALSPTIVRDALTIKGRVKGPVITTRGPRKFDRIAGLLNWGGTVRSTIAPKDKTGHQALSIGGGHYAARVYSPRRYRGKHFIEKGVASAFPAFSEKVLEDVMDAFDGIPHVP